MRVNQRVLNVLVSQDVHDMKNVLRAMVLNSGFPVTKRPKGYSLNPWVLQLIRDPCSLKTEVSARAKL